MVLAHCPLCPGLLLVFFGHPDIPPAYLIHSHVTHITLELRFQAGGEDLASESHVLDHKLTALSLLQSVDQGLWVGGG